MRLHVPVTPPLETRLMELGYCGGSLTAVGLTAVQAGLPCPLCEPFPSHPIVLLQTSGFSVFFLYGSVFIVLLYFVLFAFFWVFVYFCSVFPSKLLYCWLGLFSAFDP